MTKMRAFFIFVPLIGLILALGVLGQTRLFEKYRFEDGGYTLVGIQLQNDKNALADSLGDFYTNDVSVLNAVKKAWVFRRPSPMHACGYHYYVVLLKDGKKVENHSINLNCSEMTTDKGSLYFDPQLLAMFESRLQKLKISDNNFATIAEARKYWTTIHSDIRFVYANEPAWLKYEGSFKFTYKCPDPGCESFTDRDKYTEPVRALIARTYPDEDFELRENGGTSNGEIFFEIQSNETLFKKFSLFPIETYGGQWKPYELSMRTYWKPNAAPSH